MRFINIQIPKFKFATIVSFFIATNQIRTDKGDRYPPIIMQNKSDVLTFNSQQIFLCLTPDDFTRLGSLTVPVNLFHYSD